MRRPRRAEPIAAALAGASLGAAAGSLVGFALPGALVGAVNGAWSGARQIYDWTSPRGVVAFALDSTWALPTTLAGLLAQGIGLSGGDPGYSAELSIRQNRHVYAGGFRTRKGFAITLGNAVCNAGDLSRPRRSKLVTDHEDVHVWQARWLGPVYPVLYVGWMVVGGAVGAVVWATRRRTDSFSRVVESCAYYVNPFEWWAYSRDDNWPPPGLVGGLGWRKPAVASFASRQR